MQVEALSAEPTCRRTRPSPAEIAERAQVIATQCHFEFRNGLPDDTIEVRRIGSFRWKTPEGEIVTKRGSSIYRTRRQLARLSDREAVDLAVKESDPRCERIVFSVVPRIAKLRSGKCSKADNVSGVTSEFHLDLDRDADAAQPTDDAASIDVTIEAFAAIGLPPTRVRKSGGGGLHIAWTLLAPVASEVQRLFVEYVAGLAEAGTLRLPGLYVNRRARDVARMLGLPGTRHPDGGEVEVVHDDLPVTLFPTPSTVPWLEGFFRWLQDADVDIHPPASTVERSDTASVPRSNATTKRPAPRRTGAEDVPSMPGGKDMEFWLWILERVVMHPSSRQIKDRRLRLIVEALYTAAWSYGHSAPFMSARTCAKLAGYKTAASGAKLLRRAVRLGYLRKALHIVRPGAQSRDAQCWHVLADGKVVQAPVETARRKPRAQRRTLSPTVYAGVRVSGPGSRNRDLARLVYKLRRTHRRVEPPDLERVHAEWFEQNKANMSGATSFEESYRELQYCWTHMPELRRSA